MTMRDSKIDAKETAESHHIIITLNFKYKSKYILFQIMCMSCDAIEITCVLGNYRPLWCTIWSPFSSKLYIWCLKLSLC